MTSSSWGQKLVEYQTLYAQEKFGPVAQAVDSILKCCGTQISGQIDDWRFLLANAQMKIGRFAEAKTHYESISYHNDNYPLNYGICLLKNQLFELAFAQLNDYYLNHGEEYKAIYWLGECYYYMQKPKEALRVLQKAVDSFPDDPDAFYLMGIIHTEKGDYEKAFIYFQAAYDTKNTLLDAKFNMGLTKFYAQQLESAEEILSELALEKTPLIPEVLALLGEIRYRLHDEEGACEYWKEAINYGNEESKENHQKVCFDKKGGPKFKKKSFVSF
jgi:tetratricopeptide (TPR) repeat protein